MDYSTLTGLFQSLELADINADWVERIYSTEFTEDPDIDIEIPSNADKLLERCNHILRECAEEPDRYGITSSSLMNELSSCGIDKKTIQSWIYYLFHAGLKMSASVESKRLCLLAADLYFLLLRLPGMSRSELHHAILFEKAVNTLMMVTSVGFAGSKEQRSRKRKSDVPSSQSQKRRKQSNETVQEQEESDEERVEITPKQAAALFSQLVGVMRDFCKYLATISLRSNEVSLKHAVQTLTKMANVMRGSCPNRMVGLADFLSDGSTSDSLELPFQLCVYGMFLIVSKKHGELNELCLLLFRFLLPILVMGQANVPSSTVPRAFMQNSEIFQEFICHLSSVHGDAVMDSVRVIIQNMVAQCPDRTEFRQHMASTVSCILQHISLASYAGFCDWLRRMSFHSKIIFRSNTLAVIGRLLCLPERGCAAGEEDDREDLTPTKHSYMLRIAVERLMDSAPSVRSRALTVIIDMMEQGIVSPSALMLAMNAKGYQTRQSNLSATGATPLSTVSGLGRTVTPATLHSVDAPLVAVISTTAVDVESRVALIQPLAKCALEPKAMVRKTAVQALEMALKCGFLIPSEETMSILEVKCRDPSLMVRKQAIGSISEVLLKNKESPQAQAGWARGVLPAILDAESSVQEKSAALIEAVILDHVAGTGDSSRLAWSLITFFSTKHGESLRSYLQIACRQWNTQRKLDASYVAKVASKLDDENLSEGAWLFLRLMTLYTCPANAASKAVDAWLKEQTKQRALSFHINSITTMGQIVNKMDANSHQTVLDICIKRLKMPNCPIQLISCLVETICNLIEAIYKGKEGMPEWPQPLMEWCQKMLAECDQFLYDVIINHSQSNTPENERALIRLLYITGNVGKHCATKVPKRLLLSLQALLTSTDVLHTTGVSSTQHAHGDEMPASQAQSDEMPTSQDIPASQPLSQFQQSGGVPQHIRAHAVMNLGKICLHHKQLAKKCVPAMVRELDTCDSEMVRNNVLVILTDLCIQQTQLVDPYLADMANCLGDKSELVRRNALILLNSLLKKEYVKWRGNLIFKYLSMLCDPCAEIRSLVRFSMIEQTLRRNAGDNFFRHFVESIFYFNCYADHGVFNRFPKSDRECQLFDFSGINKSSNRMSIYSFMLEHMDDEHRIKVTGKLCCDILDAFVDGVIPLSPKSNGVLSDALAILCSQDLKLRCTKSADEEDQDMDGMQNAPAAARKAMKQKIISHVVKRNLVENIVPIIIALKNLLQSKKSPLVQNVMLCLKEIMRDYKTEVQDILAGDKQLASEIEFDLKRFEEEEERLRLEAEQRLAPSVPQTPACLPPQSPTQVPHTSSDPAEEQPARLQTPARPTHAETPPVPASGQTGICQTPTHQKENHPRQQRLPAVAFATPGPAVRNRGLGVAAILNSARKTMDRLDLNDNGEDVGRGRRAISTPSGKSSLGDLTFSNFSIMLTPLNMDGKR